MQDKLRGLSHYSVPRSVTLSALVTLTILGLTACSGLNPLSTGKVYYRVTAIHTDPAVIHVGDEVQLTHEHTGSYDGVVLDMLGPRTKWSVDRGYFLDESWHPDYAAVDPDFDPHVAKRQEMYMLGGSRWQAPLEPGPVEITCLYTHQAPADKCKGLTITVDVLPAE